MGRLGEGTEQAVEFGLDAPGEPREQEGQNGGKGKFPVPGERGRREADVGEEFGRVQRLDKGAQNCQEFKIPS